MHAETDTEPPRGYIRASLRAPFYTCVYSVGFGRLVKSDLNADFIGLKTPHYKREGRRGFSPEHDIAQHPCRIRRTGHGCRADKKCPNRSPLIGHHASWTYGHGGDGRCGGFSPRGDRAGWWWGFADGLGAGAQAPSTTAGRNTNSLGEFSSYASSLQGNL